MAAVESMSDHCLNACVLGMCMIDVFLQHARFPGCVTTVASVMFVAKIITFFGFDSNYTVRNGVTDCTLRLLEMQARVSLLTLRCHGHYSNISCSVVDLTHTVAWHAVAVKLGLLIPGSRVKCSHLGRQLDSHHYLGPWAIMQLHKRITWPAELYVLAQTHQNASSGCCHVCRTARLCKHTVDMEGLPSHSGCHAFRSTQAADCICPLEDVECFSHSVTLYNASRAIIATANAV